MESVKSGGEASWKQGTGKQVVRVDADVVDAATAVSASSRAAVTPVSRWVGVDGTHVNSLISLICFTSLLLQTPLFPNCLPRPCVHACSCLTVTMFTKKGHVDLKKSSAKFLDSKRESPKRLKDLRTVLGQSFLAPASSSFPLLSSRIPSSDVMYCCLMLIIMLNMSLLLSAENTEPQETRKLFEHHYSHIYFVFFDTLCSIEGGIRIKGDSRSASTPGHIVVHSLILPICIPNSSQTGQRGARLCSPYFRGMCTRRQSADAHAHRLTGPLFTHRKS